MLTSENLVIAGGTFNINEPRAATEVILRNFGNNYVPSATHDNNDTLDLPKCRPDTHASFLTHLSNWVEDTESSIYLTWLHGPAGAGKSAIAHALAESLHHNRLLAGSFFFSRADSRRNSEKPFVMTLAYQISRSIPDTLPYIAIAVEDDPTVTSMSLKTQFKKLIIEPLVQANADESKSLQPKLIIIDGLDECVERQARDLILELLFDAHPYLHRHIRFLVLSRPEHDIRRFFDSLAAKLGCIQMIKLQGDPQTYEDVCNYSHDNFHQVRQIHPLPDLFPPNWPSGNPVERQAVQHHSPHSQTDHGYIYHTQAITMNLNKQLPTVASISSKIRLSILSEAIVNALGFSNDLQPRFTVGLLTEMKTNRSFPFIPPGSWTDDTSMMLCLARSLAAVGGFSSADQMKRYQRWICEGYLSSVDLCFRVGNQTKQAIDIFSFHERNPAHAIREIRSSLGDEKHSGNGSLMRILPIGLVCWRNVEEGKTWAMECSRTTHPNTMCVEACQLWTCLIMKIMKEMNELQSSSNARMVLSKLSLLDEISKFPFMDPKLRDVLTVPEGVAQPKPFDSDQAGLEAWYWTHHPLLRRISATQTRLSGTLIDPSFPYAIPPVAALPSRRYVLDTLIAALYCFFATRTFEEGALLAVNLCGDADTVGAVYGGLAGCWYAGEKGSHDAEQVFWSNRLQRWMQTLRKKEVLEQIASELTKYESTRAVPTSLCRQYPTFASTSSKIRLSMFSAAMVDALGCPCQFATRFTIDFLTEMTSNYPQEIPPGSWTDGTATMLCLARSLATVGGFSSTNQMQRYQMLRSEGYLSSVDRHFVGIGGQTRRALDVFLSLEGDPALAFQQIKSTLGEERHGGNGSLMRILPIGLVCWRNVEEGKAWATESSRTTHPNPICVEACQLWTYLIMRVMKEINRLQSRPNTRDGVLPLSKLHLLEDISNFPFRELKLREALTVPEGFGQPKPSNLDQEGLEKWYWHHHPLLRLITATQTPSARNTTGNPSFPYAVPSAEGLSANGYVLHTVVAALYCFFATRTFEEGALMAVNLCQDSVTVGAVYGGLAACWYAGEMGSEEAERLFWTARVRRWMEALKKKEVLERVAEGLIEYESTRMG